MIFFCHVVNNLWLSIINSSDVLDLQGDFVRELILDELAKVSPLFRFLVFNLKLPLSLKQ